MPATLPEAWRDLPPLRRDVLLALATDHPATRRDVNERLERPASGKGTVHQTLTDLEDRGLVASAPGPSVRGGQTKEYRLTERGRELLAETASAWHEVGVAVAP